MSQNIETVIIGGGQAGLSTSYYLKHQNCEHVVLEKAARAGSVWRDDRWDSFTLLTPNWAFQLPGAFYQGANPGGFMPRAEIVQRFERYVEQFDLPVHYQTRVLSVEQNGSRGGYRVKTEETELQSKNVVIATGLYQQPRLPPYSAAISKQITQVHSGRYRNPESLSPGAVLVVGSGQSGCQIAEELYRSGRKVYLCLSSVGRVPRRYRGRDIFEWLQLMGFFDKTVDQLESPKTKFEGNPHLSGNDGGHTINLHQFARDGVILLGRLQGAEDGRIQLAPDLKVNLEKADKFEAEITKMVDEYILKAGLDTPKESLPVLTDGFNLPEITELDLRSAGVASIIWAIGYKFDFSMVKLPVFDSDGYPVQKRGVTDFPGLYFVGLPWLYKQKSGLLVGVGEDAEYIAAAISSVM